MTMYSELIASSDSRQRLNMTGLIRGPINVPNFIPRNTNGTMMAEVNSTGVWAEPHQRQSDDP